MCQCRTFILLYIIASIVYNIILAGKKWREESIINPRQLKAGQSVIFNGRFFNVHILVLCLGHLMACIKVYSPLTKPTKVLAFMVAPVLQISSQYLSSSTLKADFSQGFSMLTSTLQIELRRDYYIGKAARQCLLHLEAQQLLDMLVSVFREFHMEKDFARIIQSNRLLCAGYFTRHGQKMQFLAHLRQYERQQKEQEYCLLHHTWYIKLYFKQSTLLLLPDVFDLWVRVISQSLIINNMKTGHKNMTLEKDYDLTPWNYQTREEQINRTHQKKTVTTAPSFFKRRNYSEVDRTIEKVQSHHKFKERDLRQTMKYQHQQPLFAKTFNVTFQSQSHLRTLTTDRLKKEFQNFAKQLTSRSAAKQKMMRVKTVQKSNTAKQLRTQFLNFTQRKSQACQPQRIPLKRETVVRSHNNFFQSTINRNKSRNKSKDGKISQLLRCIRRNVIRDSNLKHLIKNTQSTFLTQNT